MYVQVVELIFFALIAFLIISKLLSILGETQDGSSKKSSFFGEPGGIKDVTNSGVAGEVIVGNFAENKKRKTSAAKSLKAFIVTGDDEAGIISGLQDISTKIQNFDPIKFTHTAKVAFEMILDAGESVNNEQLQELVDKRYLDRFVEMIPNYGKCANLKNLAAKISEAYMFGNNAFIKLELTGKDVTSKMKDFHEWWTFTKSALEGTNNWYLSNVDVKL